MTKKLKEKIRAWSTGKKALVIAVSSGMAYGICVFIANLNEHQIDSTLTQEFYAFVRWIVAASGVIGTAKVVTGPARSGAGLGEIEIEEEEEEEDDE